MAGLSPETVTRLWDEQSAALVLYARHWCDTPEDVVQEAFLLLVRQSVAPANPVGWIYRVVRTRALNAARSGRRQARREAAAADDEAWFDAAGDDRIDALGATAALKRLPEDERETIIARLWGGLSFEEISQVRGVSESTVRRSYDRGVQSLRERLGWSCLAKSTTTKN